MVAAARFHVADSVATMSSLQAQEFAAGWMRCNVRYRIAASAKIYIEENRSKEFFSNLIFCPHRTAPRASLPQRM
jgi:hypothetical protein